MIRRLGGVVLVACALVTLSGVAQAEIPAGPRLAVVKWDARLRSELFTADPLGSMREALYWAGIRRRPTLFPASAPIWSPDGNQIAFTADVGEENRRFASFPKTAIVTVSAEGGKPRLAPGTGGGSNPIFSPDGNNIAFAKELRKWKPNKHGGGNLVYDSVSIWVADLAARSAIQITPWRNGLHQSPSSFSPDGSRLGFTRYAGNRKPKAMSMAINGTGAEILANDASDPVYSPEGGRIAFLRGPAKVKRRGSRHGAEFTVIYARLTDVYVESLGSGELRRLTDTPNALEFGISWDPSGQRLVYAQIKPFRAGFAAILGFGDAIREVNADGSCGIKIFSAPKEAFFGATWQPGPGREAGPIAC